MMFLFEQGVKLDLLKNNQEMDESVNIIGIP
jgi:hypothetical protein